MNSDNAENNKQQPTPEHLESDGSSDKEILLEVISQDQYALSYTFFIIPEKPSFELTGELAETLPRWLGELCENNGWKLEFVTVKPNYLQWALTVSTSVMTSQVVIQVRTELSKLIVDLNKDEADVSDLPDMWAPGYLILHGLHQDPSGIIEQYINLVRDQQKK